MGQAAYSLAGMALILGVAVLLSTNRKAIRPRVVGAAFALQAGFAALALYVPAGQRALQSIAFAVSALLGYAREGTRFVFGDLASHPLGQNFALGALPTIVFFAALIAVLDHWRVMPLVIRWIGGALRKVTGISRVESLYAAANIFVGMSESPLVIRHHLERLAPSQVFCLMSVGLAGVAGTILALYASFGVRIDFLVAAAFMSAPGGVLMAKIIMPDAPGTADEEPMEAALPEEERHANVILAATQGAQTGLKLAVAVGAMVLAFVSLVALANGMVGWLAGVFGYSGVTFQSLLGHAFAPVFYLLGGQDWAQALLAGSLFGTKLVLNEVVGFLALGNAAGLSARMQAVAIFSLCGFANFASIAIQMAVLGGLAPGQRPVIARLGLRALAAGSLSNLMSAALAGMFLGL